MMNQNLNRIIFTALLSVFSLVSMSGFSETSFNQPKCSVVKQKSLSLEHDFYFLKFEIQNYAQNIRSLEEFEKLNGTVDEFLNWIYKNDLSQAKVAPYASYRQLGLSKALILNELLQGDFFNSGKQEQAGLNVLITAEKLELLLKDVQELRSILTPRVAQLSAFLVNVREASCLVKKNSKDQVRLDESTLTVSARQQLEVSYLALSNLIWLDWKIAELDKNLSLWGKWSEFGAPQDLITKCEYEKISDSEVLNLKKLFQLLPEAISLTVNCDFKKLESKALSKLADEKYLSKLLALQLDREARSRESNGHQCKPEQRDEYGRCHVLEKSPRPSKKSGGYKMHEKKGGDSSGGYIPE